jgi:hypothetical protein
VDQTVGCQRDSTRFVRTQAQNEVIELRGGAMGEEVDGTDVECEGICRLLD